MNNPTAPSKEVTITGLKKLVDVLEKPSVGQARALMPLPISQPVPVGEAEALKPKDERLRVQYRFWLDAMKDAELELGMEIATMKKRRKFQTTVKDALRLILDLRAGRVDVLLELFPFVRDAMAKELMR
jgi:hypothetical protein